MCCWRCCCWFVCLFGWLVFFFQKHSNFSQSEWSTSYSCSQLQWHDLTLPLASAINVTLMSNPIVWEYLPSPTLLVPVGWVRGNSSLAGCKHPATYAGLGLPANGPWRMWVERRKRTAVKVVFLCSCNFTCLLLDLTSVYRLLLPLLTVLFQIC